ncbi:uncharacterized protein EI90DRAFT_3019273 [Cantharellus anzutake]|uniref:uncharacterized protein n=1 Tax=Cantharellus anzutake TaxID=1750568 RepID=UPI0019062C13|nr:uncharacterized protein EI90DRAFT_3019273 [Cantharellus anzutake]KAF8325097.1 hypothetical protein EI90DRAFT_3019273 [Cantharellus anzutake]
MYKTHNLVSSAPTNGAVDSSFNNDDAYHVVIGAGVVGLTMAIEIQERIPSAEVYIYRHRGSTWGSKVNYKFRVPTMFLKPKMRASLGWTIRHSEGVGGQASGGVLIISISHDLSTRSISKMPAEPGSLQQVESLMELDSIQNIKGLQFNLMLPKKWIQMSPDEKMVQCSQIRKQALIGVGELQVYDGDGLRLQLGGRNARLIQDTPAKQITEDVYCYSGPRRLTTDMALNLVVRTSWIDKGEWPLGIDTSNYKSLPLITFTELGRRAVNANQACNMHTSMQWTR